MAKFEVGQEVVVTAQKALGGTQRQKVSRVGRTNVYVEMRGKEYAFDIKSGRQKGHWDHYHLYTVEDYEQRHAKYQVRERLNKLGFHMASWAKPFSTATLEKVADLLEEEASRNT